MGIGSVQQAGPGSAGFGGLGGRTAGSCKNCGFPKGDSIEMKYVSEFSWKEFFKKSVCFFKAAGFFLVSVLRCLFLPSKRNFKRLFGEKKVKMEKDLLKKLLKHAQKESKKLTCGKNKRGQDVITSHILNVMDQVFYKNFYHTFGMSPTMSDENIMKNPIPPSILLKDANLEVIIRTLSAQSDYTQQKIVCLMPGKTLEQIVTKYGYSAPNPQA